MTYTVSQRTEWTQVGGINGQHGRAVKRTVHLLLKNGVIVAEELRSNGHVILSERAARLNAAETDYDPGV